MKKMSSKKIQEEVTDLIQRSDSVPIILRYIVRIACPHYRIALAEELKLQWHILEEQGHEKAIYLTANGQYTPTWPEADNTLNHLIQDAEEKIEEEQITQPDPTPINTTTKPQTPTTMPKKSTINITNNFYGNIGQQIDHVDTLHVAFDKDMTMHIEQVECQQLSTSTAPTLQASSPDLDKFRSLLTVPYLNRKRECEAMLELITRDGYNKKDHARLALVLYRSGNVALKREHITTFRQWWKICCELLGWEGANTCYRIAEIIPNELTNQILMYM